MRIHASGGVSIGNTTDPGLAGMLRIQASATVLTAIGSDTATAGVVGLFNSNSVGRSCVLALTDGTNYLVDIGSDGSGNFNYWIGRQGGAAGTSVFSVNTAGVLRANGHGSHVFGSSGTGVAAIGLQNTAAGTTNAAVIDLETDIADQMLITVQSSTYTTTGIQIAAGSLITGQGSGGLFLQAAHASGTLRIYTGSSERMRFFASGGVSFFAAADPGNGVINFGGPTLAVNFSVTSGSVIPSMLSGGFSCSTWPTTGSAANLVGVNGGFTAVSTSLRATKYDIQTIDLDEAIATVRGLRSVFYRSRIDADKRPWPGFIAEEVEEVAKPLAVYASDGKLQSVAYDRVSPYLRVVVNHLLDKVEALQQQLDRRR
jgi:hypothetical protein